MPTLQNHTTDPIQVYGAQGFAVLPGQLPQEVVRAAREEYDAIYPTATVTLPEVDEPLMVMWYHATGGFKRYALLPQLSAISTLVSHPDILAPVMAICGGPVRLLETVVFNKPPGDGGQLAWHQDASFYPLAGGRQVSALVMLDPATEANGAVAFAIGSHKGGLMSAVDLHSGQRRPGDGRASPDDPVAAGFDVRTPALDPGDVVLFHSLVWHGSGPNRTLNQPRRLISIRYISLDTRYQPVLGNSASFMRQITSAEGEPIAGGAFPILR